MGHLPLGVAVEVSHRRDRLVAMAARHNSRRGLSRIAACWPRRRTGREHPAAAEAAIARGFAISATSS
jgi:hypothetical protein